MKGYTPAAIALFEQLPLRHQDILIQTAIEFSRPRPRRVRPYFTEAQWRGRQAAKRRHAAEDRRWAFAIDYAIATNAMAPDTPAPRGWRPKGMPKGMTATAWEARRDRLSARVAARVERQSKPSRSPRRTA